MVSEMGDWIGLLGIAVLLYENSGLALAASASLAALYLPYLFAPLLVGWTAKIPPRRLLIGADFLRAALILFLLVPDLPSGTLLALVFLASVPTSVYEATRAAAVPEYAPDEETREDALVLFQSTQQVASMIGFLVGGAALALVGFGFAIGLNALSFLVSGLLLLGVPQLDPLADITDSARGLLRNGIRALVGRPLLRRAVLLSVISASTIMAGEALVVVYATQANHPGFAGPARRPDGLCRCTSRSRSTPPTEQHRSHAPLSLDDGSRCHLDHRIVLPAAERGAGVGGVHRARDHQCPRGTDVRGGRSRDGPGDSSAGVCPCAGRLDGGPGGRRGLGRESGRLDLRQYVHRCVAGTHDPRGGLGARCLIRCLRQRGCRSAASQGV